MLPGVSVTVQNGALGKVAATDDGVAGLILQGPAPAGLAVGVPAQLFSLADAEAKGITAAYDTTNTVKVYKHIKEFYDTAGTGRELWVIILSQAVSLPSMLDKTVAANAVALLNAANGRIRMLGATRSPAVGYTPNTTANKVDLDVINALTTGQALATEYADAFKPVRIVIEGHAYTGDNSGLANLKALTSNRCSVLIGDTATGAAAAVGLLLGRLAASPVQRNPGRVKDGALPITAAYLGTATLESVESTVTAIHDKGFITLRRHTGRAGYWFSDDPTAVAASDDFDSFARGRVIDKGIVLAYGVFLNEILDEIPIDADGHIETAKAKYFQAIIENAVNTSMTANDEISSVSALCDPQQNVLTTGKICIELRITPVAYAKSILIKLGFYNPANL